MKDETFSFTEGGWRGGVKDNVFSFPAGAGMGVKDDVYLSRHGVGEGVQG